MSDFALKGGMEFVRLSSSIDASGKEDGVAILVYRGPGWGFCTARTPPEERVAFAQLGLLSISGAVISSNGLWLAERTRLLKSGGVVCLRVVAGHLCPGQRCTLPTVPFSALHYGAYICNLLHIKKSKPPSLSVLGLSSPRAPIDCRRTTSHCSFTVLIPQTPVPTFIPLIHSSHSPTRSNRKEHTNI